MRKRLKQTTKRPVFLFFLHSTTYLLYAPHWGWPWCCICECSGSTRSVSGAPHPLLHFYGRLQSKIPTAGTRQRELSCPDPVKVGHTKNTIHVQACRKWRNFTTATPSKPVFLKPNMHINNCVNHCSFKSSSLTHNHSWNTTIMKAGCSVWRHRELFRTRQKAYLTSLPLVFKVIKRWHFSTLYKKFRISTPIMSWLYHQIFFQD